MTRLLVCGLFLCGAAAAARAGELDKESAAAKTMPVAVKAAVPAPTELDKESPTPAGHYHGYGGYHGGYHGYYGGYRGYGGWGYGGWGYGGYRGYYGGWGYGGYRPWYGGWGFGLGYGGFYGAYY